MAQKRVSVVVDIQAQTEQINSKIQQVQNTLSKLKLNPKIEQDLIRGFGQIANKMSDISSQATVGFGNTNQIQKTEAELVKLQRRYQDLISQVKGYAGAVDISELLMSDDSYNEIVTNLKNVQKLIQDTFKDIGKKVPGSLSKYATQLNEITSRATKKNSNIGAARGEYNEIQKQANADLSKEYQGTNIAYGKMLKKAKVNNLDELKQFTETIQYDQKTKQYTGKGGIVVSGGKKHLEDIIRERENYLKAKQAADEYFATIKKGLNTIESKRVEETQLFGKKQNIEQPVLNEYNKNLQELTNSEILVGNAAQEAGNKIKGATAKVEEHSRKAAQVSQLKSYIGYMFSITSVFMKIRQAVTGAINDFKELDKQFNEISIVTGKSMNELWGSFSNLNSVAQEYGVKVNDVVSVQKLYYQQGRDAAEITQLTGETLKFAKISGLDFAEATNYMTASINAYKIEASEASKITDTFAALSTEAAVDANEVAVAMSKVASLAAGAGTSFEDTSAYLSKIIETTR